MNGKDPNQFTITTAQKTRTRIRCRKNTHVHRVKVGGTRKVPKGAERYQVLSGTNEGRANLEFFQVGHKSG